MKTVLGIGNALVDLLICLKNDNFLSRLNLEKGSMTLIDRNTRESILEQAETERLDVQKSSGGSVANAMHGLAKLGGAAGYIGKIGDDDYGKFFGSYMTQNNICATMFTGSQDTGISSVLISADGERTFGTYLGAAIELDAADLTIEPFRGYDYFLLEGYLVQNHKLVERSLELALEAGARTAIDLASFNIVEANLDFLKPVVRRSIDIVFANEEEARIFTGKSDPEEAMAEIAKVCEIAVVKIGRHGSLIQQGRRVYKIDPIAANRIDTTGAGDLYASGFFYGLSCGQPLEICGKIGSITSGRIVEVIGAKMSDSRWDEINQQVQELLV